MDVVADEFSNSAAACGIGEELCDRPRVTVVKRAHPIEEVGNGRARATAGVGLGKTCTRIFQCLASIYRSRIRVSP